MGEDGQESVNTLTSNPTLIIPDGWWVTELHAYHTEPAKFQAEIGTLDEGEMRLEVFGVPRDKLQHGVSGYHANMQNEGWVFAWDHVVIAPSPFVILINSGLCLGSQPQRSLVIAHQEQNGNICSKLPNYANLSFKKGPKSWRWVGLRQVLDALNIGVDDVPDFFWDVVGRSVRIRSAHSFYEFEESSEEVEYCHCLDVVLTDSPKQVVPMQVPSSSWMGEGVPESLSDFSPDKVLIPAGAALTLVHLFKFVGTDWVQKQ